MSSLSLSPPPPNTVTVSHHHACNPFIASSPEAFILLSPGFSSPSLALNRARKLPIPTINPRGLSSLSSAATTAQSTGDNGSGRGRSSALASPPITEELQKIDVNPPKGTRDFSPKEMCLRTWLFHNFREEVDFPVLETEALYIRKAGKEIRDRLYCFEDRGNRRVALMPELTPSLARLVIQKGY